MEGIKALLDYHLDNQTRADHRRLLLELAGEITERLEYLDDLDEDEQEKPGRTQSENANRRRPRHNTNIPSENTTQSSPPPRQAPPKRTRQDLKNTESPQAKKPPLDIQNGKRQLKYVANGRISRPPLRSPRWRWPPFLAHYPPYDTPPKFDLDINVLLPSKIHSHTSLPSTPLHSTKFMKLMPCCRCSVSF